MPYRMVRRGSAYSVVNAVTGRVYSRHTSKAKARAQLRILHERERA